MCCAAIWRALISSFERQASVGPVPDRDALSLDRYTEPVTASKEEPNIQSTQVPKIVFEPLPDEVRETQPGSISLTSRSSLSNPLHVSEETPFIQSPDMYKKIRSLHKSADGMDAEFVPENSLRDLFKKSNDELVNLLEARAKNGKLHSSAIQIPGLVTFICDKAPKVFATLIYSDLEHYIVHFYQNELDDTLLPVMKEGTSNKLISFSAKAGEELANVAVRLANAKASRIKSTDSDMREKRAEADANARVALKQAKLAQKDASAAHLKVSKTFAGWDDREIDKFCDDYQWRFTAPVFNEADFNYMFAKKAKMPFWPSHVAPRSGPFSFVEKWQVPRDHIPPNFNERLGGIDGNHPWVAVKVLRRDQFPTNEDFEEAVHLEAQVLRAMRSMEDRHLIQTIACYRKDPNDCFVFPWADHGNLRNYWENSNLTITGRLAPTYLIWVFTQLRGLAHAITLLHEDIIRHGDLKPENILCFRDSTEENVENQCVLVIADAGLAKINYQATQLRNGASIGPKGSTLMYEPPEAEVGGNNPISRRYDVWSMGCICLEFLVWLLKGGPGLEQFGKDLKPDLKFYQPRWSKDRQGVTGAGRQPKVDEWMESLRSHPCSQGKDNPLKRLVELIDKKLLVHNLGYPIQLQSITTSTLQVGAGREAAAPGGFKAITPSSRVDTASMTNVFELPPGSRITSETMLKEFDKILATKELFELPVTALDDSAADQWPLANRTQRHQEYGSKQGLGVPGFDAAVVAGPSSMTQGARLLESLRLDNSWEHDADSEFPVDDIDWGTGLIPSTTAPNLCPRCDALTLWAPTCSFSDTLDGLAEKAPTCALCHLLCQRMIRWVNKYDEIIYFFRVKSYVTVSDKRGQPIVFLYTLPGSPSLAKHGIQTGVPKLPEPGSSAHIQILSKWISGCDMSHPCFPQGLDFVPTRLIDVGNAESQSIRLVEKCSGERGPMRYLALSHRWGSPELHQTYCTYTYNVALFKQHIYVMDLPRTFRDAVQITRSLGVQYLWIDSLCIIQDDPYDWDTESKFMEQVFSSAYVTISASCSSGTNDGFLKARPERRCVAAHVPGENGASYYICEAIDDFHHDVDEGELSKRAWVLQERALSRRTIYFSRTQSYWECGHGVRCETLTKMKNRRASFLGDSNFPHSVDTFVKGMKIELYQGLYERFSNLQITFPGDRPVAIKGLETRLMRTLETTGGFGIFNIYLHRCLLWQRTGKSLQRITVFHGPTVPSWSWMAYMGGIRYLEVPYGSVEWEENVVSPYIDGIHGSEKEDDVKGEVPRIKAVAWDFTSDKSILGSGDQQGPRRVILDEPDSDKVRSFDGSLKCIIIGRSKRAMEDEEQAHYVLIIRPEIMEDGSIKLWERIGVGILEKADIKLNGFKTRVVIQ